MSPTVAKILHNLILVVMLVGGLGPTLVAATPLLPPSWVAPLSHVVAVAAALVLYLSQSPLLSPLLPTRPVVASRVPPSKIPTLPILAMAACVAVLTLGQGCSLFAPAASAVSADIGPTLACIVAAANADTSPSTTTIESAVTACGVAAADVTQTVEAIEALANTPAIAPATAAKIRAMKHAGGAQ